jgi:hypothetical protein|tara:strand:- start:65 stop:460 length:396 start_codon:yes stop_codon:yes gene_type:complete
MYLRFITEFTNEWNESDTGVFQAIKFLINNEQTFEYDRERLKEIRKWFNLELEKPKKFNKHSNRHKTEIAISWFKDSATKHIEKMYDMIPILENYNLQVKVIKRENPGYIVYQDEFQVVTLPHGKDKGQVL